MAPCLAICGAAAPQLCLQIYMPFYFKSSRDNTLMPSMYFRAIDRNLVFIRAESKLVRFLGLVDLGFASASRHIPTENLGIL